MTGARPSADLRVLDLGDVTLLPGLIDSHVHLAFDPDISNCSSTAWRRSWDREPKQAATKYGRQGRPRRPDPGSALPTWPYFPFALPSGMTGVKSWLAICSGRGSGAAYGEPRVFSMLLKTMKMFARG